MMSITTALAAAIVLVALAISAVYILDMIGAGLDYVNQKQRAWGIACAIVWLTIVILISDWLAHR